MTASASVFRAKETPAPTEGLRAIFTSLSAPSEHPIFHRDGDDIYLTVPVSATEAALGAKIEVPTIDGRALLKIPPGTQSGQKLRLREKGVPSATKEGARGDEIVEIKDTVSRCLAMRRRRNCCANWPSSIPRIRAKNC